MNLEMLLVFLSSFSLKFRKSVLWMLILSALVPPPPLLALEIEPDLNSSYHSTPGESERDVPVVNISKPSEFGVSKNDFKSFNVGEEGVIVNNSISKGESRLGGFVNPNTTLQGQAADVVLFGVTGQSISAVLGEIELFGKSADFILANPNGLYLNGASFINMPSVTLTTDMPQFSGKNGAPSYEIRSGSVFVDGDGVDLSHARYSAILTRALYLNGLIHGGDSLDVFYGDQLVENRNATSLSPISESASDKKWGIDASVFGSVLAGQIRLIGTEKGVGVNIQGTLLADQGDLVLTSEGLLVYNSLYSKGNIDVRASDSIVHTGEMVSEGDLSVSSEKSFLSHGRGLSAGSTLSLSSKESLILSSSFEQGLRVIAPHISLFSKGEVYQDASLYGDSLSLASDSSLHLLGGLYGGSLSLVASVIDNRGLVFVSDLSARAHSDFLNSGVVSVSDKASVFSSSVLNDGGVFELKGDSRFELSSFVNRKGFVEAKNLTVVGQFDNQGGELSMLASSKANFSSFLQDQTGSISALGDFSMNVYSNLELYGALYSQGNLALRATDFSNYAKIFSLGDFSLYSHQSFSHYGEISVLGEFSERSLFSFRNQGKIFVNGNATLDSLNVYNSSVFSVSSRLSLLQGDFYNENGSLFVNQAVSSGSFFNRSGKLFVFSKEDSKGGLDFFRLNNRFGTIETEGDVFFDLKKFVNLNGTLRSSGLLSLNVLSLDNRWGVIQGGQGLFISFKPGFVAPPFSIFAGTFDTAPSRYALDNYHGRISTSESNSLLSVSLPSSFDNSEGVFSSSGTLSLVSQTNLALKGQFQADNALVFKGNSLTYEGGFLAGKLLALDLSGSFNNRATLSSRGNLSLLVGGDLLNDSGSVISSAGNMNITVVEDFLNRGHIYSGGDLSVDQLRYEIQTDDLWQTLDYTTLYSHFRKYTSGGMSLWDPVTRTYVYRYPTYSSIRSERTQVSELVSRSVKTFKGGEVISSKLTEFVNPNFDSRFVTTVTTGGAYYGVFQKRWANYTDTQSYLLNSQVFDTRSSVEVLNFSENQGEISAQGNLDFNTTSTLLNSGTFSSGKDMDLYAENGFINDKGKLLSLENLSIGSDGDLYNLGGLIKSEGDLSLKSVYGDIVNQSLLAQSQVGSMLTVLLDKEAVMHSGGHLSIESGNDFLSAGSILSSGKSFFISSGKDILVSSVLGFSKSETGSGTNRDALYHEEWIRSSLSSGGHMILKSGGNLSLISARINVGDSLLLDSLKNILIGVNTDTDYDMSEQSWSKNKGWFQTKHYHTFYERSLVQALSTEINVGLNNTSRGDFVLRSLGDATLLASSIQSKNAYVSALNISQLAYRATRSVVDLSESKTSLNLSVFIPNGVLTRLLKINPSNISVGSTSFRSRDLKDLLTSSLVSVQDTAVYTADRNLILSGSTIRAGRDLSLVAGNAIVIEAMDASQSHFDKKESLGFSNLQFGNTDSSVSLSLVHEGKGVSQEEITKTWLSSQLLSGGTLTLKSGQDLSVIGSTLLSKDSLSLVSGRNLSIRSVVDSTSFTKGDHSIQTRLSVSIGNTWVAAAVSVYKAAQESVNSVTHSQISETGEAIVDSYKKLAQFYRAVLALNRVLGAASTAGTYGFYASASLSRLEKSVLTTESFESLVSSSLISGGDLTLSSQGDILIQGSDLSSDFGDVSLNGNSISILSGRERSAVEIAKQSNEESVTVASSASGQYSPYFSISKSSSRMESDVFLKSSILAENGKIIFGSKDNVFIKGASVLGRYLDFSTIGGNLTIESDQDVSRSLQSSQSFYVMEDAIGFGYSEGFSESKILNSRTFVQGIQGGIVRAKSLLLAGATLGSLDSHSKLDVSVESASGVNLRSVNESLYYGADIDIQDQSNSQKTQTEVGVQLAFNSSHKEAESVSVLENSDLSVSGTQYGDSEKNQIGLTSSSQGADGEFKKIGGVLENFDKSIPKLTYTFSDGSEKDKKGTKVADVFKKASEAYDAVSRQSSGDIIKSTWNSLKEYTVTEYSKGTQEFSDAVQGIVSKTKTLF